MAAASSATHQNPINPIELELLRLGSGASRPPRSSCSSLPDATFRDVKTPWCITLTYGPALSVCAVHTYLPSACCRSLRQAKTLGLPELCWRDTQNADDGFQQRYHGSLS